MGAAEERVRYRTDVDTLDADHPWHRIRAHVPAGAIVLDVGCGSGELGSFLTHAGAVDGIEMNDERAEAARRLLRTVVTGAAGPDVDEGLADAYDVIIFADVLEHISLPEPVLRWAMSRLSPSGTIVSLIPNSANWKFRRKILKGDWSYHDTGYFDRDHVRFFDVTTARALGTSLGLEEVDVEYIPGDLPKPLREWSRGASLATALRPNLFAGHVLADWRPRQA
jgi:2-polyprenyl-3-methyl-5-hydroxy-6-metoxy-1,4-benzoquinol methylase